MNNLGPSSVNRIMYPMPSNPYYRTAHWLRLRAARLRIDGHRCVICGQPARTVDHIVSRRDGGADALSNLRSLCRYHDNALKERPDGTRRQGGVLHGCNPDGSPWVR
jgi:5-methylcytosine-specific restriction endonuclease McrA